MKNYRFSLLGFIAALLMAGVMAGAAANTLGYPAGVLTFAVALGVPLLKPFLSSVDRPGMTGYNTAAVQAEIWQNHIEGNLFKNNEFLLASTDESQYVLSGKVVHIPQAGAKATIAVNRSSLPATVVQRTDTDITYTLEPYTSDPILIDNAEQVELSYDKRENVLMEHEESLNEVIADYMLTKWAPATNIIRTTGYANNDPSSAPVAVPTHLSGSTGNRLKFGLYDLKAVQKTMDNANVPTANRFGILDVEMYSQLVDDLIATKYRDTVSAYSIVNGEIVGGLLGFQKIYKRSRVLSYTNATTPVLVPYGTAGAATHNAAGLFWHKSGVARAKGPTVFFERKGDPTYYGDVYSMLQRMGGRIRRTNEENVVAVVQTAAA